MTPGERAPKWRGLVHPSDPASSSTGPTVASRRGHPGTHRTGERGLIRHMSVYGTLYLVFVCSKWRLLCNLIIFIRTIKLIYQPSFIVYYHNVGCNKFSVCKKGLRSPLNNGVKLVCRVGKMFIRFFFWNPFLSH